MDEKFNENQNLMLQHRELEKEIQVLQAKVQNYQTNRSVSSFGDLTRDDLLKRIHDLEVENANKDHHYKNLISTGDMNMNGDLEGLRRELDNKNNENQFYMDKHSNLELERDQ